KPAVELALTPNQARGLIKWHAEYMEARHAERRAAAEKEIKQAWGGQTQANLNKVINLAARVDKLPGLSGFSQALNQSGAGDDPTVLRGLYAIAQSLGEDSAGALVGGQPMTETPLDGIREAFARARGQKTTF
ncbi:MAG: hypothetical protein NC489_46115, partial [Ruminococcus flavefaciens]|nr:hypothetical protein [Ruminococcus flavefaciens]